MGQYQNREEMLGKLEKSIRKAFDIGYREGYQHGVEDGIHQTYEKLVKHFELNHVDLEEMANWH